jgi:hypothetical protein
MCANLWRSNGQDHAQIQAIRTVNDNTWHHYLFTVDYLNSFNLYVDGVFADSTTSFDGTMANQGAAVEIGRDTDDISTNYFVGSIDDGTSSGTVYRISF